MAAETGLIDSLDLGVIVLGPRGQVRVWNTWIARKSRIQRDAAIGKRLVELFPELHGSELLAAVDRVFASGLPTVMSHHFHPRALPLTAARGKVIEPVEQSVVVRPLLDGEGRTCMIQIMDITSAVKRDRRLREITAYNRTLFDVAVDALATIGRDGLITEANPSFEALTGIARDDVHGQAFAALFSPPDEAEHLLETAFNDGTVCDVMLPLVHRDGSRRHVLVNASVIPGKSADEPALYVAARDVTRRIEAERELATKTKALEMSNAELSEFAYVTSHDLRQPLRMITSYLGLIEKRLGEQMTEELKSFFGFAIGGARRMDRLILDLLEYSRTGRNTGASEAVVLAEVVEDALQHLEVAIREATAEILVADPLPTIDGHHMELLRLFQNLIGNAVKYRAADRPVRIEIHCQRRDDEWLLSIQDNGIGIAPENYERAFGIFQRLVPRDQYEGTGIGLAICKKVVDRYGGRIWVESIVDQGSTFFFTLPAK
jgi:PAS domain S-box-containing protein